jgi:hypothetical protein
VSEPRRVVSKSAARSGRLSLPDLYLHYARIKKRLESVQVKKEALLSPKGPKAADSAHQRQKRRSKTRL